MAKWTHIFLVPGGGNFATLPEAKREAQIEANQRGYEVHVCTRKMQGEYGREPSVVKAVVKPRVSNPKLTKYKVELIVSARSKEDAKHVVQRMNPATGDSRWALLVQRYDTQARYWLNVDSFDGIPWETTPKILPKVIKFAKTEARVFRQQVRIMRGNIQLALISSDGKEYARKDWR